MSDEVLGDRVPEKELQEIFQRIESLQNKLGWKSRRELAKNGGVSPDTVNCWFCRTGSPSAEDAVKIAKALGTTVEYLVTGDRPQPPESAYVCAEQARLLAWIERMNLRDVIKTRSVAVTGIGTHRLPSMPDETLVKKEKVG